MLLAAGGKIDVLDPLTGLTHLHAAVLAKDMVQVRGPSRLPTRCEDVS